jgi:hypothetical protein
MTRTRPDKPDGALVIINEVPGATSSCDLDLPPVHPPAAKDPRGEIPPQLPVPVIRHARLVRISRSAALTFPGAWRQSCSQPLAASLLPDRTVHSSSSAGSAGGGDWIPAPRAHSAGSGTGPQSTGGLVSAARISGSAYASAVACQSRIRVAIKSGASGPAAAASASSAARVGSSD